MLTRVEPSRRTFLVGLGRYAAATSVMGALPAFAADGMVGACPPPSAWTDLAKAMDGSVLRPQDPFFADTCRPNNLRYAANLPAGIARCASAKDVQACIAWVRKQNLPFAIRSGGHNYAGYSTTSGLLIDMTPMAGATPVKGRDDLVQVSGGTINALLYKQMERLGRTITHGRCDGVGAAGFLLGGGIGFDMRKYGMASDLMRETELVTADGSLVTANEARNDGLFWACRGGGGGNFGVSTGFTLQTFPVDKVTVFQITWKKDLKKVLRLLLTELATAPDEFGSKISVSIPSRPQRCEKVQPQITILGQLQPSNTTLQKIFASTWELADERVVKEDIAYWEGADFLAETTFPYFYQEKSSYMKAANITEAVVDQMFMWADGQPGTSMPCAFKFFQLGGAINRMKPTETAYVHRGYDWLFSIELNWWRPTDSQGLVDENLNWQQNFYDQINVRAKAAGAFLNFPDPSLKDWKAAYYGVNYDRLARVKREVDPTGVFTYAQAIRPA